MIHAPVSFYNIKLLRKWSFSIMKRYARTFKGRYIVEKRMGVYLLMDRINKVDSHLLFGGVWEPEQLRFLKELVCKHKRSGEDVVFLDVGAHGALYALILDKEINFDQIIAYEPVPINLIQLRANLLMNNCLRKVQVIDKAVSDQDGTTKFIVSREKNRAHSRMIEFRIEPDEEMIDVEVTTIDNTVGRSGALIVAKIDVEGNEGKVIAGMCNTIKNNRAILQIERNKDSPVDLDELLTPLGMKRIHSIGPDNYFVKL